MAENGSVHDAYESEAGKRIMLITYPCTASNILLKMLSLEQQQNIFSNKRGGCYFWDAFLKGRTTALSWKRVEQWTDQDTEKMRAAFQQGFNDLESESQISKIHGKIFFTGEHAQWFADPCEISNYLFDYNGYATSPFTIQVPSCYGPLRSFEKKNFTIFPDAYLDTWTLTFLIRHPALAFPSFYRIIRDLEKGGFARFDEILPLMEINASLRWTRLLYDLYSERKEELGFKDGNRPYIPLLLDAHDIIHDHKIVRKYCELTGMDPDQVKTRWNSADLASDESIQNGSMSDPETIMRKILWSSNQLIKDKDPSLVHLKLERRKWDEEFGEEMGVKLEYWVKKAMPDYNYLYSKRLTLEYL